MGGSGAQLGAAPWIVGQLGCVGWVGTVGRVVTAGWTLLLLAGCEHATLLPWDDGYRHRSLGFSISAPPATEPPWERIALDTADLAYRRREHEVMSLRVSCRRTQAPPRILSRNLRIGVGSHVVRSEAPVKHHGLPGWRQTFDAGAEGGAVRVATVTLIDGPCTVDFAFSARDHFEASAPDFERWWTSYRPARASTQELPP